MREIMLQLIVAHGPIKRRNLLDRINDKMFEPISDRAMRKEISGLIMDGEPIASSEKGYSIITNVRELTEAVNYLKAKARSISIRGNTLIGNYDQKYQDAPVNLQFKLF